MKKILICLFIITLTTGCKATYNLDISEKGFQEDLTINATQISENQDIIEFPYVAYYDAVGNNENREIKVEGVEYYNSSLSEDENELKKLNYNYLFKFKTIKKSNIIANTFETFIIRQYDHDEDGTKDYILISTSDDFIWFENFETLETITVNINCHYKVISSNADNIEGTTYTWNIDKNNKKSINMVYDPNTKIDDRSFFEKFINSIYGIFTIIFLIGIIGYIYFGKYVQNKKNDI